MSIENLSLPASIVCIFVAMGTVGVIQMFLKEKFNRRLNLHLFAGVFDLLIVLSIKEVLVLGDFLEDVALAIIFFIAFYDLLIKFANFCTESRPPQD